MVTRFDEVRLPWSEIGIDVSDQVNIGQALEQADLDFEVKVLNTYYKLKGKNFAGEPYKFIVRTDRPGILGMCKSRFVPLQNKVLAEIGQPWIDEKKARLDTIGNFGNGEKVWILLKLDLTFNDLNHYILLINGHDGSTSIQLGIIPFRLSCSNQLGMVSKYTAKFRHTENASDMLQFFKGTLDQLISDIPKEIEIYKNLENKPCTLVQAKAYFKEVLKLTDTTRSKNILEKLKRYYSFETNTFWGAFNAINTYLNYDAGRSQESRLYSFWFAKNGITNLKALELAKNGTF